jgi:hypothetical protein
MFLGLILTIAALTGLVYGIVKKRTALVIASVLMLICIIAIGVYFYKNPY